MPTKKIRIKFGDIETAKSYGIKSIVIKYKYRRYRCNTVSNRFPLIISRRFPLIIVTRVDNSVTTRNGTYLLNDEIKFTWNTNTIYLTGLQS